MKSWRQGYHLTGIPALNSPFKQCPILVKGCNIPEPLGAGRACDYYHIRHVAGPHTTTDGQLDALQQPALPPFSFKPFDRNFRQTTVRIATTAAPADCYLPHHKTLGFEQVIAVCVQSKTP